MPFAHPPSDPWPVVEQWLAEAGAHPEVRYAHAACLSTVAEDGGGDGRVVLAERHPSRRAFVVLTDVESPKAVQLRAQPRAALTFYWPALERQLRLRGTFHRAEDALASQLFEQRPRQSRATAWASRQSQPLVADDPLDRRLSEMDRRLAEVEPIPRPDRWHALEIDVETLEFWQAGARRLHQRLRYLHLGQDQWRFESLEP